MNSSIRTFSRLSPRQLPYQSTYVCVQCRQRINSQSSRHTPILSSSTVCRRNGSSSSSKLPYTEKLRRKIWGTDTPPGQEDPYGGKSILERNRERNEQDVGQAEVDDLQEGVQASEKTPVDAPVAQSIDSGVLADYVPATTWDGLDHIGGATGWWEESWDAEHQFEGFMSSSKAESVAAIRRGVRRAVIEVYTLKDEGRPLSDATRAIADQSPDLSGITFAFTGDGSSSTTSITYQDPTRKIDVLSSMSGELQADTTVDPLDMEEGELLKDTSRIDAEAVSATSGSTDSPAETVDAEVEDTEILKDSTWLNVSLRDEDVKFAVLSRVMQLTGKRIPDPVIGMLHTTKQLVEHLVQKPKPKKLAELLLSKEDLISMPNVQIYDRRYTPIDKEKEVGRWKVIERELQKRGLPITGHT